MANPTALHVVPGDFKDTQRVANAINQYDELFRGAEMGVADLRRFGATATTNSITAVTAAIAAGYTHVFLPAGFFYRGGGTGAEAGATEIPANLEIIGENPQTSLIKAVDRTNSGVPGFIYLNKFSTLTNCGTQSYPGDQITSPAATQKTAMQPRVINTGDAKITLTPWTGSTIIYCGANLTSPESVVSTDNPGIQIVQASGGDAFFAGTTGLGVGFRAETDGNGDNGILIVNANTNPANTHGGLAIVEFGTNAVGFAQKIERKSGSTSPLFLILDDNASGAPATAFPFSLRIKDSAFGTNAQYLFAGDTTAIRIWTSGGGTFLEGIDAATGVSSYQGLIIGASTLVFQISGSTVFQSIASALLAIVAGTTAKAQINFAAGVAPTTPNNGDMWFDGTNLKMQIGGVTKNVV